MLFTRSISIRFSFYKESILDYEDEDYEVDSLLPYGQFVLSREGGCMDQLEIKVSSSPAKAGLILG